MTLIKPGVHNKKTRSHIVPVLDKLADPFMVVCSGIQDYSLFKTSIGYDMSRLVFVSCPPDSVCDIDCAVLYVNKTTQRKLSICSKCNSLKWQLSRRKRQHDNLTPSQITERQSSSSRVRFDVLSPCSKKARFDNMRETIHHLKCQVKYSSGIIDRLSTNEKQNREIGHLVNSICVSSHGSDSLQEVFFEADNIQHGLGDIVKGIWEKEVFSDWKQFLENQENNGKCMHIRAN